MYKNYKDLIDKRLNIGASPKRVVVASAADEHALEAVFEAQKRGFVTPILVGDKNDINELIKKEGFENEVYEIVHCEKDENPSAVSVALIHEGKGDFIMKGKMETKDLLRPILNKKTGLNDNGFITHFGFMQIKGYHKLIAMSDCAVIPYPSFEDKVKIVDVCTKALIKLGYKKPVVAALCATESVNNKMPETLDAAELAKRSDAGEFGDVIVLGPISYDLATSKESAKIKGYDCEYAGNVDMLLVPQMVSGNIMSKIWNANEENILAGCLIGANVPIALTSRSASMNEKLHSILLCSLLSSKI